MRRMRIGSMRSTRSSFGFGSSRSSGPASCAPNSLGNVLAFIDFLDSREKAVGIWLVVAALWLLPKVGLGVFGPVLRSVASWKLLTLFGSGVVWAALVVLGQREVGLWDCSLLKETIYWYFGTAVVLLGNSTSATTNPNYLRRLVGQALRLTLLVEFLIAFYVFPLLVELIVVPVVTLAIMLTVVAESDPKFASARRALNFLITAVGLVVLSVVAVRAISEPDELFTRANGEELMLAPILTGTLIPLLYAWALVCGYEQLFMRAKFFSGKDRPFPRGVRRAIFRACGLSLGRLTRFSKSYTGRLFGLQTQGDLQALISDFEDSEQKRRGKKSH